MSEQPFAAGTLAAALEREHREIDGGVDEFTTALKSGERRTDPLLRAFAGLRRHIYLEEEFLFPPLRQNGLMAPLFVMVREHGELWQTMDRIEEHLQDADADDLLARCEVITAQLDSHNSKEEPIIYPQADAGLSDFAAEQLHLFLESGHLPDGWVCQALSR